MHRNVNILLTGVTGFRNRGVEALVLPILKKIIEYQPNSEITIATCSPIYDKRRLLAFSRVSLVKDPFHETGSWIFPQPARFKDRIYSRIKYKFRLKHTPKLNPISANLLLSYDTPDLLIVTGGDIISSDYGKSSLEHALEPILWASSHGIPSAILAHSVGKFKSTEHIEIWKKAADKASLITVREPLTYSYLVEDLGHPPEMIHQTADTAFLLSSNDQLQSERLKYKTRPTVALALSSLIASWTNQDDDIHFNACKNLVSYVLGKLKCNILLVPHVQEDYGDDREFATRLWRETGFDNRVEILAGDHSASEMKAAISSCDLVIAERMHAAIAGFSSGVPTVPVSYSIKALGITSQLYEDSGIRPDEVYMTMDSFLDNNRCIEHLDRVWHNADRHKLILNKRLAAIKNLAENNFSLLNLLFK